MSKAYQSLVEHFQRLSRLQHAMTFLQWDQLVMMPPAGNDSRSQAITELVGMHHEMLTNPRLKEDILQAQEDELGLEEQKSLMEMQRVWQRASCVPGDLVKAQSLVGLRCEHGWREQREDNDWSGFLNNFQEVLSLSREEAQTRQECGAGRFETPYDALLDLYCTGDSSALISIVFQGLKAELPALIEQVVDVQKGDEKKELVGPYPVEKQKQLSRKLMEILGFDFRRGRLDESVHPFSTGDRGDNRITTRYRETEFSEALLATAHETGHASYENGLPKKWAGLPVGQARNMCIHESQSLLFEKQLFLSRPFVQYFSDVIGDYFPEIKDMDGDKLWQVFTKVEPSLIRVEADEVTYPMHVILRYEIESSLINQEMEAEDIPEVWDEKMQRYLGISTAGNYKEGCMQDIHWTDGAFGYFPSYTLGAVNAAQLFWSIREQYPDWQKRLEIGETTFVRQWLEAEIWKKGSILESQELMMEASGKGTDSQYFLDHIRARYLNREY